MNRDSNFTNISQYCLVRHRLLKFDKYSHVLLKFFNRFASINNFMNKSRLSVLTFFFLFILFIGLPSLVNAQPDPGCDVACNCRADGSICPIDSWVFLLIAAGIVYGIKKFHDSHKKSTSAI